MVIQAAPLRSWACTLGLPLKLDRPQLSPAEIKSLEAAMRTKAVSE